MSHQDESREMIVAGVDGSDAGARGSMGGRIRARHRTSRAARCRLALADVNGCPS